MAPSIWDLPLEDWERELLEFSEDQISPPPDVQAAPARVINPSSQAGLASYASAITQGQ